MTGRKGRHVHRDAHIETQATSVEGCCRWARRHLLCLVLVGVAAGPELAHGATASAASAPIERFYAALLTVMKAGKTTPFRQRYDSLAPVIDQTFDLAQILGDSVGPRWATLPSDQQSALREAFLRYTIAVYVANFDSFSGQRFEVQPTSTAVGEEQIVQTRIVPASGESHRLDYVMRQLGGTWKVVDVLADGSISRVAVQRSEMRSPLANGGVPALLDRLQKKTADMSGGQLR
jgi:phospholipid transport system substrate-binding protein